jgi:hypothetical protein
MGVSDLEIQKKVFRPRRQHEVEKQSWPQTTHPSFPTLSSSQTETSKPKCSISPDLNSCPNRIHPLRAVPATHIQLLIASKP